ncbi:Uncharacterized protein FKW44_024496 [Caligus rogercresseyi]|uniref:Uncharacterized protein n=1 Tax=Caligus rogercresseyi TaxID=217165 RepID=A0A7T8GM63_CALRO|nr:Uncharacterized protein FKW44_024496 [Caligus rogercresseyi]
MEMESTTIPPTTGSPEYRFIFPQEDVTVHPLETEESVLVNEAGVPRVCISYVDTLRRSF